MISNMISQSLESLISKIPTLANLPRDGLYIGGSTAAYTLHCVLKDITPDYEEIDIYTTDAEQLKFNIQLQSKYFDVIGVNRCNYIVRDKASGIILEFVLSSMNCSFQELLTLYDCSLTAIGYDLEKKEVIVSKRFYEDYAAKTFHCVERFTAQNLRHRRMLKLQKRAVNWFDSIIQVVPEEKINAYLSESLAYATVGNIVDKIDEEELVSVDKNDVQHEMTKAIDIPPYPPYLFHFKRLHRCKHCNQITANYIHCNKISIRPLTVDKSGKVMVVGGGTGFGSSIVKELGDLNIPVTIASSSKKNAVRFVLGEVPSDEFISTILEHDTVIFNSYITISDDDNIWFHRLETFDWTLFAERVNTNLQTYVELLKKISHKISDSELKKRRFIFIDAEESKYDNNINNGYHPELNMCKSAFKSMIATVREDFKRYNLSMSMYDPGWLNLHANGREILSKDLSARILLGLIAEDADELSLNAESQI